MLQISSQIQAILESIVTQMMAWNAKKITESIAIIQQVTNAQQPMEYRPYCLSIAYHMTTTLAFKIMVSYVISQAVKFGVIFKIQQTIALHTMGLPAINSCLDGITLLMILVFCHQHKL